MKSESSYIFKVKFKPTAEIPGSVLFLVGENVSREEWVKTVRQYSEDLDLRTASFVDHLVDTVCKRPQALYGVQEEVEG